MCSTTSSKIFIGLLKSSTLPFFFRPLCMACAVWGLVSCGNGVDESGDMVARVGDHVLNRNDLRERMPATYLPADSARHADQVVNKWVRDKALLRTAERELTDAQKDVQAQLEAYRASLLIYAYESALINQRLDTIVGEDELRRYYQDHIESFELKRFIVKTMFVKLDEEAPKQTQVEQWLKSDSDADFDLLYDYCRSYAENFYVNNDVWLYLDDLLREVPLPIDDAVNFLKQNRYYTFGLDGYTYFVRIDDYKLKGDAAPLSLEEKRIKDLILNKRKAALISEMREKIVTTGLADGTIKITTY